MEDEIIGEYDEIALVVVMVNTPLRCPYDELAFYHLPQVTNQTENKRGAAWYARLTPEQNEELQTWYQAWLDVTKTRVIPETPEWI